MAAQPATCVEPRELLRGLFDTAIASAAPDQRIARHLPPPPKGRVLVIGAGKASAAMARAVERSWPGELSGLVVTRYGYGVRCERIDVVEAGHPVPDAAGFAAAQRILESVRGLTQDDLVLCLISGGGSALLAAPLEGLSLEDEQSINRELLRSGASVSEMNCVRRHLSAIKGGRLAAACYPAQVLTLCISDVPGDNPVDIASGPTVGDPSSCADALEILHRYDVPVSRSVLDVLESSRGESIKPGDPRLANSRVRLIATPLHALQTVAAAAQGAGFNTVILGDCLEGEAREMGKIMAGIALSVARHGYPVAAPCCLLSGGETTVTVRGKGRGGRNVEYLLALAVALEGFPGIWAIAGDTDGVDGTEDIAGAIIAPDTLARASGLSARDSLADNNAHGFFERLGDSVITGPTFTNVNDFRAILITRGSSP